MDVVTSVFINLCNYRVPLSDGLVLIRFSEVPVLLICVTLGGVWLLARHVKITYSVLSTK